MKVQPFRLIGERASSQLRAQFDLILADWSSEWIPEETRVGVEAVIALHEFSRSAPHIAVAKRVSWLDDNWCALLKGDGIFHRLGNVIAGEHTRFSDERFGESDLAREVAERSLTELAQRLLAGSGIAYDAVPLCTTSDALPVKALKPGSGAVVVRLKVHTACFDFVLSQETVNRYIEAKPKSVSRVGGSLVAFDKALTRQTVNASVRLGSAEFALHELASFQVGDVVTLDSGGSIDKPCTLVFEGATTRCQGYIGRQQNRLAFRLTDVTHKAIS